MMRIYQFEVTTSSVLSEIRNLYEDVEGDKSYQHESSWSSMSDKEVEKVLIGLTGEKRFSTPFEIDDEIKRVVMARTEQASERASNWSLNDVGSPHTLRSI